MRILHTADWHLGKLLHGVHLTEDQAYMLDNLYKFAQDAAPDVIIIAGDIYDRAVPPSDAVNLLDETLSRFVLDLKIPTLIIAGNHDSPERLNFASKILEKQGLHLCGRSSDQPLFIDIDGKDGSSARFFLVPYPDPAHVRMLYPDQAISDHQQAFETIITSLKPHHQKSVPSILITHAFVTGGESSESERPLSVGGSDAVRSDLFDDFSLVTLGHLHKPQAFQDGRVSYSGSLLKYSFSESEHTKSVSLIEMKERGEVHCRRTSLDARRDMRRMKGDFGSILEQAKHDKAPDDYIEITLTDRDPVFNAMARLREYYPNVLHVCREFTGLGEMDNVDIRNYKQQSDSKLFRTFYQQVTGYELDDEQTKYFQDVLQQIKDEDEQAQ